jgi:opacity protein-like surface antigen
MSVVFLLGATAARAEVMVTPFAGVAFGGVTSTSHSTYGVGLGFLGHGIVGFEAEIATSRHFFGTSGQGEVFTPNDVVTLMGNVLVAVPAGPVRVYGAAGAGLLKTRLRAPAQLFNVDSNDFGIDVGGGVIASVGSHVALRGDLRYFRAVSDPSPDGAFDLAFGKIEYWRAVGGLTLKF